MVAAVSRLMWSSRARHPWTYADDSVVILIDPVVKTYEASGFTAWPIGSLPAGHLLQVSGGLSAADVGTVMAVIASRGVADGDTAVALALLEDMIGSDCLTIPGGLRIRDTDTGATVNPGCCFGLENWREWRNAADGDVPWLGHSPSPWIEHHAERIRVWPDGGEQAVPPEGASPVEITVTELPGLIDAAHLQLREFLELVERWAVAWGQPRARQLASAIGGHLHITEDSGSGE